METIGKNKIAKLQNRTGGKCNEKFQLGAMGLMGGLRKNKNGKKMEIQRRYL